MKKHLFFVVLGLSLGLARADDAYDPLWLPQAALPEALDLTLTDAARHRDVPLRIYLPTDRKPAPVVLFSHGLGGSRQGSAYLGRHWAARGYVAVFLQHPGSDDSVWKDKPRSDRAQAMADAASLPTAAPNLLLRVRDVSVTLDQLAAWHAAPAHPLAGRLDLSRVGMSGHSFGAITTQAVSGQQFPAGFTFMDARITAAVILSPSSPARGDPATAFTGIKLPCLLMTGTKDVAKIGGHTLGTADVASRLAVFPALPPGDKYELVLDGANHFAFTDRADFGNENERNPNHHRVILALSTAFWDAYLRGDAAAKDWLTGDGPRSVMETKDRWQKK